MHKLRALTLISGLIFVALATVQNAQADPLVFGNVGALQNNNLTTVDLFSNPGVTLLGQQITFRIDISGTLPAGVTNILQITYQAAGGPIVVQSFEIPLFGSVFPPFTHLVTIPSTGATPGGTPVIFTVDILGSSPDFVLPGGQLVDSFTYSFVVTEPVPEPVTLITAASGLAALAIRLRRSSRRAPKS